MGAEFKYNVFLSHSSKDKAVVRPIAERLRADGMEVWFDDWVLKPGDSIPAKIEEGLEQSRVLVLCMSANAFGSDWAQLEGGTFRFRDPLNKERRFIPLRLDDAPIKGSLAQFLYINWRSAGSEQEYAKLLGACRGEIELSSTNKTSEVAQVEAEPANPANLVHIEHSGSGDIVLGNKTVGRARINFTPGPQHISPEKARKLSEKLRVKHVPNEIASGADDAMPSLQTSRPVGEAWSGLRGLLQRAYSTQIIKDIVGQAGLTTTKIQYSGTYKGPYLDEVDRLIATLSDGERDQFVVGCVREVFAFERTKANNLSKLGVQSDGQVSEDLRRVLANFGHDLNELQPERSPDHQGLGTPLDNPFRNAESSDTNNSSLRWSSCADFFSSRFATAFPGIRDEVVWYSNAKNIGSRLERLLRKPLKVGNYSPIWWWRGLSSNSVEQFRQIDDVAWLLNDDELQIGRIAAVQFRAYWQSFVYVEAKGVAPSGAYDRSVENDQQRIERRGYCDEELCFFRGRYLKRTFFEDGVAEIDGQLVDLGGEAELRRRLLSKYNFVLSGQDSAINNTDFEMQLDSLLNEILVDPKKFEQLIQEVEKLPKQVGYFNHQDP